MANEQFAVPRLPFFAQGYGWATPFGTLLPPSGKVAAYVRSTGAQDQDDPWIAQNLVTTIGAGLARCRASQGDVVYVLPGHTESFTDNTILANLVAGTRIIGVGRGAMQPKLRITNTAGQFQFNKADVIVVGMHFALEGANGITKAILVTGADNTFVDCDFEVASGATAKSTIAFEIGTGGDRCRVQGCVWRGTATHNVTDGIKVVAAVDQVCIRDCEFEFSATAGNGNIHITGAATSIKIVENYLHNTHTSSTACIKVDDVASTGHIAYNATNVENNGTASAQGVVFAATTTTLIRCNQNFCSDEAGKSGILCPTAAT